MCDNQSKLIIEQLSRSIVPVVSEHDDMEETRYSIGGTAFLVRYKDRLVSITAKHVIANCHSDPTRLRIRSAAGGTSFLPLKNILVANEYGAHGDIALIEIDQDLLNERLQKEICPILLDDFHSFNRYDNKKSMFWIRGYPSCISDIDYDATQMRFQGFVAEASYKCPSHDSFCHTIHFGDLSGVESLNGLSGSPVFHFMKVDSQEIMHYNFAGMLIRGTKESQLGHFIDSYAIYAALEKHSSTAGMQQG